MPLCKLTFACFFKKCGGMMKVRAAGGRCAICHSWVCLATPRTSSRFTLALVLQCSTTVSNTYKDLDWVSVYFVFFGTKNVALGNDQIDGDFPTLHSNPRPLFGTGAYTAQSSPTTVNNLAFPLCTHPSTLNRKKCAVQVHLTKKGG